ncbi:hypothetical protein WBJ53_25325 [Spirosoma sp. SC4-14]|uniref:hypothetical protein n=1 Tax=Spirosoma sp. SC4-14 TaxID=3128900 RepID=UPI0030CF2AF2
MKRKAVIITGAGFTLSSDFGGPSTAHITRKLRELDIPNLRMGSETPGEYFYKKLCYHYTRNTKNDCDLSVVNFETIIHLLEELYSHLTSYNSSAIKKENPTILKNIAKSKGVKPAFLRLKEQINKELREITKNTENGSISETIRVIYAHFINMIINELENFNTDDQNLGMRKFQNDFLEKNLPNSDYLRRCYTMNYDTWLNKYLNFYDGFDSNGKFEPENVMKRYDVDCHYNLHGSILWRNDLDANKMTKLENPVDYLKYTQSSDYGLNREPLIATPIITGYHKSERMKYNPYLQFYYALQSDIISSDLLILIGYGFSDTHINNILSLFKGKCVVVGYMKTWIDAEYNEKKRTPIGQPIDYENVSFDIFDDDVTSIIESIEPYDGGFEPKEIEIQNGWIKSKNGNTIYWWKGIGEDFYQNWSSVIS